MNFNEEQQAHVDSLIKKKYAEAYSKAEQKAAETIAAAEAKYKEELDTLKGQVASLQAVQGESNERVRQALLKAEVSQLNAVNAEQVMKLTNDSVIIGADGKLTVVDAEGKARFTAEGKEMTVKEFISEFLDANPHLKLAPLLRGAGSMSATSLHGTGVAKTIKRGEFDKMGSAQKSNFINSGGRLIE